MALSLHWSLVWWPLEEPQHCTTTFLLLSFSLICRAILCLPQCLHTPPGSPSSPDTGSRAGFLRQLSLCPHIFLAPLRLWPWHQLAPCLASTVSCLWLPLAPTRRVVASSPACLGLSVFTVAVVLLGCGGFVQLTTNASFCACVILSTSDLVNWREL